MMSSSLFKSKTWMKIKFILCQTYLYYLKGPQLSEQNLNKTWPKTTNAFSQANSPVAEYQKDT